MSRRFQGGESSEILSQSTVKNEDMIQCRHEPGTINDSDKAIPLSVVQSCPVATCETAGGTAAKVGIVNNFSDFTLLNGREVLVYFASGNTADNPTFNLNNTGAFPLALENQISTVSIGSGCWEDGVFLHLKYVDITVSNTRIQKWIICGHRIASQSSTQTTYADGQGRTNTVASGNMKSVTSNAVANAITNTVASGNMKSVTSNAVYGALPTPYLAFDKDTKTWSWHDYNIWDTSNPLREGQLVVVYCTQGLSSSYWSGDTQGVINLSLQNTNSEKSIRYKCVGIVKDFYIDIVS